MSLTSAPPRRDLYELAQTITGEKPKSAADTGGFLVPKTTLPRLTVRGWTSGRIAVYNADFASDGQRFLELRNPWTVVTPINFRAFKTHHEALTWALQEATK